MPATIHITAAATAGSITEGVGERTHMGKAEKVPFQSSSNENVVATGVSDFLTGIYHIESYFYLFSYLQV